MYPVEVKVAGRRLPTVSPLPTNGVWRALLKMEPKEGNKDPVDIRCALKRGEEILSETWTYHWSPP